MSEKKKGIDYEFGHKRETRKSYQSFLEELMSDPGDETSLDTSDDGSVRRSKRTPVPKRGFKLIDDYDSKEPLLKKKCKGDELLDLKTKNEKDIDDDLRELRAKLEFENEESRSENSAKMDENVIETVAEEPINAEQSIEPIEDEENDSPAPRKSGRARKAKTFEDCIIPGESVKKPTEIVTSDLSDAEAEVLKKKVIQKLNANTPIGIKEEKIIGKDNVEYLYRNVFVTEILDSRRKRTCRLSKDSEKKEETDKSPKSNSTEPNKETDSKELENQDSKRKKTDVKVKPSEKAVSIKSPKQPSTPNSSSSDIIDSKRRKSCSSDSKDTVVQNDKPDSKKINEINETPIKKTLEIPDSKRKRSSLEKQESKKINETTKRTSIETPENNDSTKRRTSSLLEKETPLENECKKKDKDLKSSDKKHKKDFDEKKSVKSDIKKHVKFAEKEEIKVFEKDVGVEFDGKPMNKRKESHVDKKMALEALAFSQVDQVIPTLADSVKARRKNKKASTEESPVQSPVDTPEKISPSQCNQGSLSRKNKRNKKEQKEQKEQKEDILPVPIKMEAKEQKSPLKNEKSKSMKEKESDKTMKENKKAMKIDKINDKTEENDFTPKKEMGKQTSKKKLSPSTIKKEKLNDAGADRPIETEEPSPPKKKKSKSKSESANIVSNEVMVNGIKEEAAEAPIVLTFKSSDIKNISSPKKKVTKNHLYDKTSTKISKKTELKKSKKQNKKKTKKLIVSFKNNQSFQPKKKKIIDKEEPADILLSPTPSSSLDTSSDSSKLDQITPEITPEITPVQSPLLPEQPLIDTNLGSLEEDEVKHKKKSKKKSKAKLKKHQKIVNVETFTVIDQTVVKVKKKKIYKNRNGEKVLIRLIKNHCNRNGDIVKTETIMVDNDSPSIDEEKGKVNSTLMDTSKSLSFPTFDKSPIKSESKSVEDKPAEKPFSEKAEKSAEKPVTKERKLGDRKASEKKNIKKVNGKRIQKNAEKNIPVKAIPEKVISEKKIKEDSPEYFPHLSNDIPKHTATKRKSKFKHSSDGKSNLGFKSSEKRPIFKKNQKILKKPLSRPARPANKNVTVGGKVVGKTTKGMKKTGGDMPDQQPIIKRDDVFQPIPPELPAVPVTEPKNVYNFFCRKYRPIVVQQFPKADFSEISRRLAALWKTLSETERQEQRDKFEELHSVSQQKLAKLGRLSPTMWSESDLKFIKKNISENDVYSEVFSIPKYPVKRLSPIDMAAHLSLLGDSLNMISGALQQQSLKTVHGAMSLLLDSMLSALAPLVFFTSHIPEMKAIDDSQQARILDNLAYILPGL